MSKLKNTQNKTCHLTHLSLKRSYCPWHTGKTRGTINAIGLLTYSHVHHGLAAITIWMCSLCVRKSSPALLSATHWIPESEVFADGLTLSISYISGQQTFAKVNMNSILGSFAGRGNAWRVCPT